VRQFLRLAQAGVYDGMAFHRVVPHVKGIVSTARGEDPASATASFFICTAASTTLDGRWRYTAFGRVVDGLNVVEAIEAAPRNGEAPITRIELKTVRVEGCR
jgi:cyclophilin family peptidyl-prolyl cis-trans isomerase